MRIILGADHGGFSSKERIREVLKKKGIEVIDVGAKTLNETDDYVDYSKLATAAFLDGDRIVLFCRNGFGMAIAANRTKGIRCGVGFNKAAVEKGRSDDDINCLSIPSDYLNEEEIEQIIEVFLNTGFSSDPKYLRRINKMDI